MTEIVRLIENAIGKSCPLVRGNSKKNRQPGWTQEIQAYKARVRTEFKRYKREPSPLTWDCYVEASREFKKLLRNSEKAAWKDFTEESEGPKALAKCFE